MTGSSAQQTSYDTTSGSNSVVECNLAKVEVEGSNPFSRSIFSFTPPVTTQRAPSPSG